MRFHSSWLFHTGQSLLADIGLCASTRLVFFTLVNHCWRTLTCALHASCLFHTSQSLDFGLCALSRLVFYHTGQSLLEDFGLCASTRFVFFTQVSHWTLTCMPPLVLSFSHWSATGLWLVRFHSSCFFSHWSVTVRGLWLVRFHSSCLFSRWSVTVGGL